MNYMMVTGLQLMGIGMGVVFLFLVVLVGCMHLMSASIGRFVSGPPLEPAVSVPTTSQPDAKRTAAVVATVAHHHAKRHTPAGDRL